jgi:selenoprotein W-related protein
LIEKRFGVKPTLRESSGGVFEVTADGALIFSKKAMGRFPDDAEVLGPLAEKTAQRRV